MEKDCKTCPSRKGNKSESSFLQLAKNEYLVITQLKRNKATIRKEEGLLNVSINNSLC